MDVINKYVGSSVLILWALLILYIGIFAHTRFFPVWLKEYLPVKMFYPPKKGIMSIIVRILLIFFGIWEILYGIFTIIK